MSTWTRFEPKKYHPLDRDLEVESIVIGGGIAGTTALYLLAKEGKRAALIDKGALSASATAYTTAFVTHVVDTGLSEMREMFDERTARDVWQSHKEAIDMIERNVNERSIECEFLRIPNFIYANDEKEWESIKDEAEVAEKLGFEMETRNDNSLRIANKGYAAVPNQAKFHPLKYLDALRQAAKEAGAFIFEDTEAKEINEDHGIVTVKTTGGTLAGKNVLVATHDPFNKPAELFAHKGVYTTYIVEFEVPKGSFYEGIYEDEENPYHYFRVDRVEGAHDRLILGGKDHRHEVPLEPEKAFGALEGYLRSIAPGIECKVVDKWKGPIIETADGLAFIGPYSEKLPHAFVATGFSGNGMTYGTTAGMMFSDFAHGKEPRWQRLYDPRRSLKVRALWQKGKDYVEEFVRGYGSTVARGEKGEEQ